MSTPRTNVKVYLDGAGLGDICNYKDRVSGFTTNPTLMRKAGVADYEGFARRALEYADPLPVSLEVFADDPEEIIEQARKIASWGHNAYVKIPVTNTRGMSTQNAISILTRDEGVPLNVTAVFTRDQVDTVGRALGGTGAPAVVSVFAGRVADTGREPRCHMSTCRVRLSQICYRAELLWASPRQVYDLMLADVVGCDIITMSADLIDKMGLIGRGLEEYSRETVQMFYRDAQAAGYHI